MNAFFKNENLSAADQLPGVPEEITIFDLSVEAAEVAYSIFDEEEEKRDRADEFFFQYGGVDEFQMKAEMQAVKERQMARQRHAGHVANRK